MRFSLAFMPRTLAKASSFSPWMVSTGLRLSTLAMVAPAAVTRPLRLRYSKELTVM